MSTKTITLSEDAYELLRAKKKEKESFSDVVRRISKPKSLMEFAGLLTNEEADKVEEKIRKGRQVNKSRFLEMKRMLEK